MRKISQQILAESGKRNFGRPTCLVVSDNIVVGTSKGLVLAFDQQENVKAIIGAGTKAAESGAVTSLAISSDHSTVAAGHVSGHIFTWEISRSGRPFLHVPPINTDQAQSRKVDGHITGAAVLHIGFLGYRHTALVSADDRGMAFSHLATRGMGAVGRTVRTTRILGRYPELVHRSVKPPKQSSVLAFAPLPLGNVERATDNLGLVAMLTPYLLVLVSTTPVAQTQHKAARPKEVAAHSAMSAALAWFPAIKVKAKASETSNTKLAYCWSNVLTILEVHEIAPAEPQEKDRPPEFQFIVRSRYRCEEAIVAIQWISRSVLALLTITQQLLILEDMTLHITDSSDLLPKHIYHSDLYSQQLSSLVETLDEEDTSMHGVVADAFHMSFRAYKGRLYLLGQDDVSWGSLTNWADRLLALMAGGDFIGAIRQATTYLAGSGEKATIGLPEEDDLRSSIIRERLLEMISASLKYAFGQNQHAGERKIDEPQLGELATACVDACLGIEDQDFLFDEVFTYYDEHDESALFFNVLEPYIMDGQVSSLPPLVLKGLVDTFALSRTLSRLEEIICLLDTSTMDIDQVTTLCKKYNLFDAYIYVWNKALDDYVTPIQELLTFADSAQQANGNADKSSVNRNNAEKMFPYLSFCLTGRVYPTGIDMEEDQASSAKTQIYGVFFLDRSPDDNRRFPTKTRGQGRKFDQLRRILAYDVPSFIGVLNEAFEDSFLNTRSEAGNGAATYTVTPSERTMSSGFNRQFIIHIMLEVMSSSIFTSEETIYLDMFIARNLPKYPQYLLLSGTTLQEILTRLCHYPEAEMRSDAQLSVEYLLSVYKPPDLMSLVPILRHAHFFRILKSVYLQEQLYSEYITMFFADEEDKEGVFSAIESCLSSTSGLSDKQRAAMVDVIRSHIRHLVWINVAKTAITLDRVAPDLHHFTLQAEEDDENIQFEYLQALFQAKEATTVVLDGRTDLVEQYVVMMCRYQPSRVADYLRSLKDVNLSLDKVVPALEEHSIVDATVMLLAQQGELEKAMQRLVAHLNTLKATVSGILRTSSPGLSRAEMLDSVTEALENLRKYVRVGTWLCRNQTTVSRSTKQPGSHGVSASAIRGPLSFTERLWVDLINATVGISTELGPLVSRADEDWSSVSNTCREMVQEVFTALLNMTAPSREAAKDPSSVSFLRILRGFLSHAASVTSSLAELRSVLGSIFSAFAYEESLIALANSMLDQDVFVQVERINRLRRQGWRPRGQVCEICRRRVWGPGVGSQVWEAWQEREQERQRRRHHVDESDESEMSRGKGKGAAARPANRADAEGSKEALGAVVTFSCRHIYHQQCLSASQGSEQDAPAREGLVCPACA